MKIPTLQVKCNVIIQSEMLLVHHEIIDLAQREFTPPIEEVSYIRRQSLSASPLSHSCVERCDVTHADVQRVNVSRNLMRRLLTSHSSMPTSASMFTRMAEQHFGPAYSVENRGNEDIFYVLVSRVFCRFRNMRMPNIRADCMAQTVERQFGLAYTVESRGNEDRNCIPISRVFDRFRNMRTTNIRADCMAQTAIRKRSLSTTRLPYACVDWRGTPNVVTATVDVGRNVRRCLTGASSDVHVNAGSLAHPSNDRLLAPGIIKNHGALDGTTMPISDISGRFRNMNTGEFCSFKAKLPQTVIDYKR
ncbi:hypothetical protein Tco_0876538 [Tanacetum coccineum]|uniref:Uncharacterized protein n=1 Tax=Tanacetum coccineum TaxID=301880 RepID=A0ABQ5BVJ8_9ASTR